MTTMETTRQLAAAILLVTVMLAAPAALCEEAEPVSGSVSVGGQAIADDPTHPAKFLEYRDVPSGFVIDHFAFTWAPKRLLLEIEAIDVSQKDQRGFLNVGEPDNWKASLYWRQNPRLFSDHATQLYAEQSGALFTLDNSLQRAVAAAPASVDSDADGNWDAGTKGALIKNAIANSGHDVDLGWSRKTVGGGVDYTPTRYWNLGFTGERERRSGLAPQTLGMYFRLSPSEVAAPVDFTTDTAGVYGEYHGRDFLAGVRMTASAFDTGNKSLTWDDQLYLVDTAVNATTANPAQGRTFLSADNRMQQWTFYGAGNLPGHTRISGTVSQSVVTQDDAFIPMTTNTLLDPAPLPADSLDGEYRTNVTDFSVSSHPLRWLGLRGWWREYEIDNRTPSLFFPDYVMTDYQFITCGNANACGASGARISRANLPFARDSQRTGAAATVTPIDWLELGAFYEREAIDRRHAAVEEATDTTWKVTADLDISRFVTVRGTYGESRRRADEYDAEYFEESFPNGEPSVAGSNHGERIFMWTDRDRKFTSAFLQVTPIETLSFYGELTFNRNEYLDPGTGQPVGSSITVHEDRDFDGADETYTLLLGGRISDEVKSRSVGASYSPGKNWELYADYTWERMRYAMASRFRTVVGGVGTDNPLDDWGSQTRDGYETYDFGFHTNLVENKLTLDGSMSRSKGTGEITNDFVPGGDVSGDTTLTEFPMLTNDLFVTNVSIGWKASARVELMLRYWYERWTEDNWASDFMKPYMGDPNNDPGSVTAIYLGTDYDNYRTHVAGLFLKYEF